MFRRPSHVLRTFCRRDLSAWCWPAGQGVVSRCAVSSVGAFSRIDVPKTPVYPHVPCLDSRPSASRPAAPSTYSTCPEAKHPTPPVLGGVTGLSYPPICPGCPGQYRPVSRVQAITLHHVAAAHGLTVHADAHLWGRGSTLPSRPPLFFPIRQGVPCHHAPVPVSPNFLPRCESSTCGLRRTREFHPSARVAAAPARISPSMQLRQVMRMASTHLGCPARTAP